MCKFSAAEFWNFNRSAKWEAALNRKQYNGSICSFPVTLKVCSWSYFSIVNIYRSGSLFFKSAVTSRVNYWEAQLWTFFFLPSFAHPLSLRTLILYYAILLSIPRQPHSLHLLWSHPINCKIQFSLDCQSLIALCDLEYIHNTTQHKRY